MNGIIITFAEYVIFIMPLFILVAYTLMNPAKRKRFVVAFLIAGIFGYIFLKVASMAYYDPRPFVGGHVQPLFAHSPDNGFPSDHTFTASLAAFIVMYFSRKLGIVMVILAALIGVSRVLAHVHSWIDIIGAIIIAALAAAVALAIGEYISRRYLASDKQLKESKQK